VFGLVVEARDDVDVVHAFAAGVDVARYGHGLKALLRMRSISPSITRFHAPRSHSRNPVCVR